MAYIVEMISKEKVVSSVKRFSNFSASKELPFDLEDAMVFWINRVRTRHQSQCRGTLCSCVNLQYVCFFKVNIKMREIVEKELKMKHHLLESPSHQKVTPQVSVGFTPPPSVTLFLSLTASSPWNNVFLVVAYLLSLYYTHFLTGSTVSCVGSVIETFMYCDPMSTSNHPVFNCTGLDLSELRSP